MNPWDLFKSLPIDLPSLIGWLVIISLVLFVLFGVSKLLGKLFGIKGVNKLYLGNIKPSDYIARMPKNTYVPIIGKDLYIPRILSCEERAFLNKEAKKENERLLEKAVLFGYLYRREISKEFKQKINSKDYWNYINRVGGKDVIKRQDDK